MKKVFFSMFFFTAIGAAVLGCKKGDNDLIVSQVSKQSTSSIQSLRFNTHQELFEFLIPLREMNDQERIVFESQNNYKSLYTKLYEIYEIIDAESLENLDILHNWVEENSEFLEIVKIEDGELEYRPKFSSNPFCVVADENRLFYVGEYVIKIFEDGIISTRIDFLDQIDNISCQYLREVPENPNFEVSAFNVSEHNEKSNCGSGATARKDNNKNRTRLTIGASRIVSAGVPGAYSFIEVRPYKKSAGIWFHCKRTISGSISSNIHMKVNGVSETFSFNRTISPNLSFVQIREQFEGVFPGDGTDVYFDNYNASGSTPSAGPATLFCP